MKSRLFLLIVLIVPLALVACGSKEETESPFLRMLHFVPDTSEYRQYLTYGDAATWHASWDVPRIDNVEELQNLSREKRAYWISILSNQTTPPDTLGWQYLLAEDQRSFYGFDLFNLDRYMLAGQPPDTLTVVEFSMDGAQIAQALTALGYDAKTLDEPKGTLYSILDDYEVALDFPTKTGQLGHLNRIALLERQMVIAKATANVTQALQARDGERSSLADRPDYMAAAKALEDPALQDMGERVGVILMEGAQFYASASTLDRNLSAEDLEKYAWQGASLPPYKLVAFATRHSQAQGASYLILAVVFDQDVDAGAAAETLAHRLRNYSSLATQQPLDEYWTFEKATGVEAEGLPVAVVVMRADDPPPTPQDAPLVNTAVWAWMRMIVYRDTLFLALE